MTTDGLKAPHSRNFSVRMSKLNLSACGILFVPWDWGDIPAHPRPPILPFATFVMPSRSMNIVLNSGPTIIGVPKGTRPGEMPRSNQRRSDSGLSETDVQEVWFAGCHCDVGGGSVESGTRNTLARISLRWMIRQCFLTNTGIQFYRESSKDIGLDFNTLYPFVTPRPAALQAVESVVSRLKAPAHNAEPTNVTLTDEVQASPWAASTFKSEENEELVDALCPIFDELKLSKAWWILEIIPMKYRTRTGSNKLGKSSWRVNLGRPREIPRAIGEKREKMYVHRSVKIKMEAEGLDGGKYVPRVKFDGQEFEWVD